MIAFLQLYMERIIYGAASEKYVFPKTLFSLEPYLVQLQSVLQSFFTNISTADISPQVLSFTIVGANFAIKYVESCTRDIEFKSMS